MPLKRYADFQGRSQRKEFWMFQLIYAALFLATVILVGGTTDMYGDWSPFGNMVVGLIVLAMLGLFIPSLAVQARRFHDQDKSGWLVLLNLIPYLGSLVVFVFMLLDGTPGPNRFGDDPKGR
jgi:Predicted membrane protein